jgi:hypothetical protein
MFVVIFTWEAQGAWDAIVRVEEGQRPRLYPTRAAAEAAAKAGEGQNRVSYVFEVATD